jgi:hypothetical protein
MGNPKDRPEQDGGGAALSFDDVLGRLDAAIADMNAIHTKLHTFKVVPELDLRKLPKPGPPKLGVWTGELRPRPSDPTPDQLWAAWKAGGVNWVGGLDRRTARALARVVADPSLGGRFLDAPGLLGRLLGVLRPFAQVQLAARLYFLRHPPHPALNNLGFGWESEALPRWWAAVGPALPPAAVVAQGIATAVQRGVAALPADLDLPDLDLGGKWELAIAQAAPITSADHAEALLHFLDGGPVSSPKPVRPAAAVALRAWVAATERGERVGREVARALSLRVGSPFGGEAAGRWVAVPELLPKVRAWLAGEVLEVVFEHLHPTIAGHQLAARKAFWRGYTGRVLRVWVAVSDNIKKRKALDHPDVRKIREAMGTDLKVMDLNGGAEQALVWMHLQGGTAKW